MLFIGDKVKIKAWNDLVEEYGIVQREVAYSDDTVKVLNVIDCDFYFSEFIASLCGFEFSITKEPVVTSFTIYDSTIEFEVLNYNNSFSPAFEKILKKSKRFKAEDRSYLEFFMATLISEDMLEVVE